MQNLHKVSIASLLGLRIINAEGKCLGHVADIRLTSGPDYRVTGFFYGRRGWMHRMHVLNPFEKRASQLPESSQSDCIPWEAVELIESSRIVLKPGYSSK